MVETPPTAAVETPETLSRRSAGGIVALLIVVAVAVNLWWTNCDRSSMPVGDSYVYLTNLLRFLDGVGDGTLHSFSSAMRALSFGGRPPVYQLLTAPFILIFGRNESAALMVNGLFIALLILCTYRIGLMLRGPAAGVLAAGLVVSYPPVVNLSKLYLPYCALPAMAALSLWLLLRLVRDRSVPVAWGFGASLGFGLLVHPNFLWFAAPTALVGGLYLVLFQNSDRLPSRMREIPIWLARSLSDRFVLVGLGAGAVIAIVISVPWYLIFGRYLLGLLKAVSSNETAAIRGAAVRSFGFPDVDPGFWWYLLTAPGALSWFFVGLGLAGLMAALVAGDRFSRVLAVAIVATYGVLSSGSILVWWFPPLFLPGLAALTAWWIVGLRWRSLSMTLFVLSVAVAIFNFSVVTWGVGPRLEGVARALGSPVGSETCATRFNVAYCPAPPEPRAPAWPVAEIVGEIQGDPDCQRENCLLMVTKIGELSLARFSYLAVREWPGLRLDIRGEAARVWGRRYNLKSLLESDYLLYPDSWIPESASSYKLATIRLLQSPPPVFAKAHRTVAAFDLPGGRDATLLRRVEELTAREAVETVAALDLKDRFKVGKFDILSDLYVAEGNLGGLEALYDEATREQVAERTIEMIGHRLKRLKAAGKKATSDLNGGQGPSKPPTAERGSNDSMSAKNPAGGINKGGRK